MPRDYLTRAGTCLGLFVLATGMTVQAQVSREQMIENIRSALITLPYYGVFDYLEFSVQGRTVTLTGYATRPTLKKDAEAAVHDVKGVEEVVNKIEVLPLSPADDRIRRALYRSIYGAPSLQRYGVGANPPIHIIVRNGNVSLHGIVSNEMDKNIAGIQARSVGGTFSVKNNLQVESASTKAE